MLFNSYLFLLIFLPLTLLGYYGLNRLRQYTLAKIFLILMSLWFYGHFNPVYLAILIGSVLFNFFLYKLLFARPETWAKRLGLALGLALNLGALFVFKYFDFFLTNVNLLFKTALPLYHILLPLGISFFTFQQLSFVIDAYRGDAPEYSFVDYALFVVFFPQLIAGPIVRHGDMVPQFQDIQNKAFDYENFARGIFIFVLGLAKKVLLADTFGIAADAVWARILEARTLDAIMGMFAFTMQIYFDFSGYCDMAVGLGLMMNIRIARNFDSPYKSLNTAAFWRRWHMTLGSFFTDYLYIPLGGSRGGKWRMVRNVMIVFLISGLWHGANYTFILWGALHGVAVVVSRLVGTPKKRLWRWLSWLATFLFINVSWVLFRADTIQDAGRFFMALGNWGGPTGSSTYSMFAPFYTSTLAFIVRYLLHFWSPHMGYFSAALWLLAAFYFAVLSRNAGERLARFRPTAWRAGICIVLFVWSVLALSNVSRFLYFNF